VILAEAGLAPALATFADTAPLPVEIMRADERRYPASVETAAYFAVTEAVEDAIRRNAHRAMVAATYDGGRLVVTIEDDGSDRLSPMAVVTDRVGALGGDVVVAETTCRVEIPCV
jgi:signal transduction histidine kinase